MRRNFLKFFSKSSEKSNRKIITNVENKKLREFLQQVYNNTCPEKFKLNLWNCKLSFVELTQLIQVLRSGSCPQGLSIDLRYNNHGVRGGKAVAEALISGKCPRGLSIDLRHSGLGARGGKAIAEALMSGQCPQGLSIDLRCNDIGLQGGEAIAKALQSGQCPQGLSLDLRDNGLGVQGTKTIANALQSGRCPQELSIKLGRNRLGVEGGGIVAKALLCGQCPRGLSIGLDWNRLSARGGQAVAQALMSGQCPQGLSIDLSYNNLGVEGAEAIAKALRFGQCPQGLSINLWDNNLGAQGVVFIAQALQSGQCPQGLSINLGDNDLGVQGAKVIVQALLSGRCPQGLSIELADNKLGVPGGKVIAKALRSDQCPAGLRLGLKRNKFDTQTKKRLANAWKIYQQKKMGQQQAKKKVKIIFSNNEEEVENEMLRKFLRKVDRDICPENFQLHLGSCKLTLADLNQLTKILQSGKCPQGLSIKLWDNKLGVQGIEVITKVLQSGRCPQGLSIDLSYNNLGVQGAKAIAKALQSGQCPQGLSIKLNSNNLGVQGGKVIGQALVSGRCPQGLSINLLCNNLGAQGGEAIAQALASGRCPQGLSINLFCNNLGVEGGKAIGQALASGRCPQGLRINLDKNKLGAQGGRAIIKALRTGRCPHGLKIGLFCNELGAGSGAVIAKVLQSGQCPRGLSIEMGCNGLDAHDGQVIAKALASDQCPTGLELNLVDNKFDKQTEQQLANAWYVYHQTQKAKKEVKKSKRLQKFFNKKKRRKSSSVIIFDNDQEKEEDANSTNNNSLFPPLLTASNDSAMLIPYREPKIKEKRNELLEEESLLAIKAFLDVIELTKKLELATVVEQVYKCQQTNAQDAFIREIVAKGLAGSLPQLAARLTKEFTHEQIKHLLLVMYSQNKFNFFQTVYEYCVGKKIDWLEKLDLGKVTNAYKKINEFMDAFCCITENGKQLEHEKLFIFLLKDQGFLKFLQDDSYKPHREMLTEVIKQLKIPEFDVMDIFSLLSTFQRQFNRLPKEKQAAITTYKALGFNWLANNRQEDYALLQQGLNSFPRLLKIIEIFIQPQTVSLSQLIRPVVQNLIEEIKKGQKNEKIDFSEKLNNFESIVKKPYIGILLQTPVSSALQKNQLMGLEFASTENNINTSNATSIIGDFKNYKLDKFCFKQCIFNDFSFAGSQLYACDFTEVMFHGKIDFSNVEIDHVTANTLLPSLHRSMIAKDHHFELIGKMKFVGSKVKFLSLIPIDSTLKDHVIARVNWCYSDTTNIAKSTLNFKPPRQLMTEAEKQAEQVSKNFSQGVSSFIYNNLSGAAQAIASSKAVINLLYDLSGCTLSSAVNLLTSSLQTVNQEQNQFNETLKKMVNRNTQAIDEITQKTQQTENVEKEAINVANEFVNHSKLDKKQLKQLQNWQKIYELLLPEIKGYWQTKRRIAQEQQALLHHVNPSIRLFYKILLVELLESFLALFLLQSNNKIRNRLNPKEVEMSNQIAPPQSVLEQIKFFFSEKNKKDFWSSVKQGGKNLLLATSEDGILVGSLLTNLIKEASKATFDHLDHSEKKQLETIREACTSFTPQSLAKLAERLARRLTQAYAMPIGLLTERSAVKFAEKTLLSVVVCLLSNDFSLNNDNDNRSMLTAIELSLRTNKTCGLVGDWDYLHTKLSLKNNARIKVMPEDIFQRTGICYFSKNDKKWFYFVNAAEKNNEASLLGYTRIEEKDCDYFLTESIIFDEEGATICKQFASETEDKKINKKSALSLQSNSNLFSRNVQVSVDEKLGKNEKQRHLKIISTIFQSQETLSIAKSKLFQVIERNKDIKKTYFKYEKIGSKLIIQSVSKDKLIKLRDLLLEGLGGRSFKKCIICDNALIISCYLKAHVSLLYDILCETKLAKPRPTIDVNIHAFPKN